MVQLIIIFRRNGGEKSRETEAELEEQALLKRRLEAELLELLELGFFGWENPSSYNFPGKNMMENLRTGHQHGNFKRMTSESS